MRQLFPDATLYRERVSGLTKSIGAWAPDRERRMNRLTEPVSRARRPWPVADVLGVPVDGVTLPQLLEALLGDAESDRRATVLHANVHGINLAQEHRWLKESYRSADLVYCDGFGVRLAARMLGYRIPPRLTAADWMWDLAARWEESGHSIYFLGSRPGVAERAADRLQSEFPGLRILGTHHGYFDKAPGGDENRRVVEAINRARPDLLCVGFGMPLQERWLRENRVNLEARVALALGATFDFLSGDVRRAPTWMTSLGLEWLGRLLTEPHRLWRRYAFGNPLFLARVLASRARRGTKRAQ